MDEERKRILRMLAEGKISTDECAELLEALADRREAPKPEDVIQPGKPQRATWPYMLLILLGGLAGIVLISLLAGITIPAFRRTGFSFLPVAMTARAGAFGMVAFIFWIWMIVDCLGRAPYDFRLLFTQTREHDKWIWIAIVVLTHWVGALLYFLLIRQPARSVAPLSPPRASAPPPPPGRDPDYVPPPRARSLKWPLLLPLCTALVLVWILPVLIDGANAVNWDGNLYLQYGGKVSAVLLGVVAAVFWFCMLVSCLARDYRDFGTLIPSDPAADKIVWLLIILFIPVIGAIAYHVAVRRRVRPAPQHSA